MLLKIKNYYYFKSLIILSVYVDNIIFRFNGYIKKKIDISITLFQSVAIYPSALYLETLLTTRTVLEFWSVAKQRFYLEKSQTIRKHFKAIAFNIYSCLCEFQYAPLSSLRKCTVVTLPINYSEKPWVGGGTHEWPDSWICLGMEEM